MATLLKADDSWTGKYYFPGSRSEKERLVFA